MGETPGLLPRRCALSEISRGSLVAVHVEQVRLPRLMRLVYRDGAPLSHAAEGFLETARAMERERTPD